MISLCLRMTLKLEKPLVGYLAQDFCLGTTEVLDGEFSVVGSCSVYCRMLSSSSGFFPVNASNIPQIVTIKNCLRTLPNIPWGAKNTSS